MEIYQVQTPPTFILQKHFLTNYKELLDINIPFVKSDKRQETANVPAVFDIEVSSFYVGNKKQCCMYAWVFGINGKCIRGRTWSHFLYVLTQVREFYKLGKQRHLVIYVHNLSYEFQFFRRYFEWDNVFSLDDREPIYAITKDGFEFRCSYLLSGYSLAKVGENLLKYKVSKMVGDLDYREIRHSSTPLTDTEWTYILNDGLVVMAYIQETIERVGDITKIPLTKTGYVRNLCRDRCLKGRYRWEYNKLMQQLTMTTDNYTQLKRVFAGGFTHANINYVGKVIPNVHSFDFTSSYPAVMVSEKFPMSQARKVKIFDDTDLQDKLDRYCCMFECRFTNICTRKAQENYISISKCNDIDHYVLNNGRVIEATTLSITVTEVDFKIIKEYYVWDKLEIKDFNIYQKAYLPKPFIECVLSLYKDKTELKGVKGKEVEYLSSKEQVNASYGMCVTDPCRDEILYYNDTWTSKDKDIPKLISQYNGNRSRFLYYPWGVWVTAYARRNLFTGISEFGNDYIYSDTDSIKCVNAENHLTYIRRYNREITHKIIKCLDFYGIPKVFACPKTKEGVPKPIGVWDDEGVYSRFKTLGAKRYLTEKDGELEITIAGVNKKKGIKYLSYTYGDNTQVFENFTQDLLFPAIYDYNGKIEQGCGKLCHTYIDEYMTGEVTDYLGNTHSYSEFSGVHMEDTHYNLSLTDEFVKLLHGVSEGHIWVRK